MAGGLKRFKAALERLPSGLGWTVARVPFDPAKVWTGMVRKRVVAEVGGVSSRTSLFPETGGGGYFVLLFLTKMRRRLLVLGWAGLWSSVLLQIGRSGVFQHLQEVSRDLFEE